MTDRIESRDRLLRIAWWVLATVLGLTIAIRIRLLGIPLERDEGEYAYAGQLMLQGIAPYKLAYNMKFPGTYAAYAVIMSIFGQTITDELAAARYESRRCPSSSLVTNSSLSHTWNYS